jgi:hypothetical protein
MQFVAETNYCHAIWFIYRQENTILLGSTENEIAVRSHLVSDGWSNRVMGAGEGFEMKRK